MGTGKKPCPTCKGSRTRGHTRCGTCAGTGRKPGTKRDGSDPLSQPRNQCVDCRGRGWRTCRTCHGYGDVW
jgi:DnaJ-class molecular chaperone